MIAPTPIFAITLRLGVDTIQKRLEALLCESTLPRKAGVHVGSSYFYARNLVE